MKTFAAFFALVATARAAPLVLRQAASVPDAATIARLAPDLGATPPLKPSGFGDCLGPVNGPDGQPARVPCACPPTRDDFIRALTANVQAGFAVNNTVVKVTFPTGDSLNDKHGRITASAITLQNLAGPGKGCPLVATTLGVQSKQLDQGGSNNNAPSPAVPAPASSTAAAPATDNTTVEETAASSPTAAAPTQPAAPSSTAPATGSAPAPADLIAQLAPDLGATPPLAPTGFGDCEGPVKGADGKPARVPCACPPTREAFIKALTENVLAGFAVNNTAVKVTFPTGDSFADRHGRITASAITLQNLEGPGKGCPLVATTLGVQSNQLDQMEKSGSPPPPLGTFLKAPAPRRRASLLRSALAFAF